MRRRVALLAASALALAACTGTGNGPIVIVHLTKPGTFVRSGDLLIELDRAAQIKTAHDREAEYRDCIEQINKKHADQPWRLFLYLSAASAS